MHFRQIRGFLQHPAISSLPLLISDPAQLPLTFWTATLRYCSLLHKHSCYDLSLHQGLYQPSNQSQPQAVWCRTSSLNRIEPMLLNITLIVLNCLHSTLLSLFKHVPHEAHLSALICVGSGEWCGFCLPLYRLMYPKWFKNLTMCMFAPSVNVRMS